ncbi:MAG: Plug domain-containing protein, partial [Dyella sp.]
MLQTITAAAIRRALNRPHTTPLRGVILLAGLALAPLAFASDNGADQVASNADGAPSKATTQLPTVKVNANGDPVGYAMRPDYAVKQADLGPLGQANLLQTPYSVSVVPADLLVNSLAMDPTELLRYLPSTQLEYRSGAALGRPQSRGFEGEMVSNSRIDGLNAVDSTSYGIEQFDNITVLNGLAGAL